MPSSKSRRIVMMKDFKLVLPLVLATVIVTLIGNGSPFSVCAFQPMTVLHRQVVTQPSGPSVTMVTKTSSTVLSVFNDNLGEAPDDNTNNDRDFVSIQKAGDREKMPPPLWSSSKWLTQVKDINNKFWDYTCSFLYVAISGLILLNFLGFGYTITMESGLDVMPIDKYRTERQWREEISRHDVATHQYQAPSLSQQFLSSVVQRQENGALWDGPVDGLGGP